MGISPTKVSLIRRDELGAAVDLVRGLLDGLGIPVVDLEGEARNTWGALGSHSGKTVWVHPVRGYNERDLTIDVEVFRLDADFSGGEAHVASTLATDPHALRSVPLDHSGFRSLGAMLDAGRRASSAIAYLERAGLVVYVDTRTGSLFPYGPCSVIRHLRSSIFSRGLCYDEVADGDRDVPGLYAGIDLPGTFWKRGRPGGKPWMLRGKCDFDTALSLFEVALLPPISLF